MFIVVNVVNGLFVETALNASGKDEHLIIQAHLSRKQDYLAKIKDLYERMDEDASGEVTMAEFTHHLAHEDMQAFAASLELQTMDLSQFFGILSNNGTQKVDLETFVVGCIKLKGMAKSMDLMDLMVSTKQNRDEQRGLRTPAAGL